MMPGTRDNGATAVDATYGATAAQEVIDLFPIYGQVDYDATNSQHVTVGRRGVIAVLYERGGTSSTIAEVEWNQVFGDDGIHGVIVANGSSIPSLDYS